MGFLIYTAGACQGYFWVMMFTCLEQKSGYLTNQVRSRVLCTLKSSQCISLCFPYGYAGLYLKPCKPLRCRRVRGPDRGASACRAPAGATPERSPGHGFRGREADMAGRKEQGHPLPEGAAGQLFRDVPPQWSTGEGTAPPEGRQRARRRRRREQKRDIGKRSARAEQWENGWKTRGETFLWVAVDRENWIIWNLNVTYLQCKLSPCIMFSTEEHCPPQKGKKID